MTRPFMVSLLFNCHLRSRKRSYLLESSINFLCNSLVKIFLDMTKMRCFVCIYGKPTRRTPNKPKTARGQHTVLNNGLHTMTKTRLSMRK